MRYWIASLTILLFFIWILPLGVFIKPAQEAKACGGQRAVCLCSHADAKTAKAVSALGFQKGGVSANKEAASSGGGAGHYFMASTQMALKTLSILEWREAVLLTYQNPSLRSTDHVPKA